MSGLTFLGFHCVVKKHRYRNGQTALNLYDAVEGDLVAMATRAIDAEVPDGHVAIKNYSENEGILAVLTESGIVEPTGKTYPAGFTHLHECRLLI